jgi:hypothetical protein
MGAAKLTSAPVRMAHRSCLSGEQNRGMRLLINRDFRIGVADQTLS